MCRRTHSHPAQLLATPRAPPVPTPRDAPFTGYQSGYYSNKLKDDVRVAYKNPNLPWIVALHRFDITFHSPKASDTAWFRFPPDTPPGQYIAHYMWGGYRDCVDIDVLPDHKPVPQTKEGIYGYRPDEPDSYLKNDHCQYAAGQYDIASDEAASCAVGCGARSSWRGTGKHAGKLHVT